MQSLTPTIDLQPIPAIDALRRAHTHLSVALAPYAMKVGEKVDALDFEHIQKAFSILELLLDAQLVARKDLNAG